jgi:hypothetical protein
MKLNEATKARQAEPETFCPTLSVSGVTCLIFPANFGVSPELRVRVKGRETFVRVGGMVHDALESLGPWGRSPYDPASTQILSRTTHARTIRLFK